jgi:hypothetical protein
MDAQGTMRLMFDTMDAYDRADFTAWPRSTPRADPAQIRQLLALVRARLAEVRDTTQSAAGHPGRPTTSSEDGDRRRGRCR